MAVEVHYYILVKGLKECFVFEEVAQGNCMVAELMGWQAFPFDGFDTEPFLALLVLVE